MEISARVHVSASGCGRFCGHHILVSSISVKIPMADRYRCRFRTAWFELEILKRLGSQQTQWRRGSNPAVWVPPSLLITLNSIWRSEDGRSERCDVEPRSGGICVVNDARLRLCQSLGHFAVEWADCLYIKTRDPGRSQMRPWGRKWPFWIRYPCWDIGRILLFGCAYWLWAGGLERR